MTQRAFRRFLSSPLHEDSTVALPLPWTASGDDNVFTILRRAPGSMERRLSTYYTTPNEHTKTVSQFTPLHTVCEQLFQELLTPGQFGVLRNTGELLSSRHEPEIDPKIFSMLALCCFQLEHLLCLDRFNFSNWCKVFVAAAAAAAGIIAELCLSLPWAL